MDYRHATSLEIFIQEKIGILSNSENSALHLYWHRRSTRLGQGVKTT